MPPALTVDQVLGLAPDAGVAKAARGLATAARWQLLGQNSQAIWGDCQGSAASPYETAVDLSGPAFHCSCPSHKRPCKHALALLLLFAAHPDAFPSTESPQRVTDWLTGRAQREQQRAEKRAASSSGADLEAQARRTVEREAKVAAGLDELDLWLRDLMRRGLGRVPDQPPGFWESIAARMVDAQAPGLARWLREAGALPSAGTGWQERLMEQVARLFLLMEACRRREQLSPDLQADVRALVGWVMEQDDLLAEAGVRDLWLVVGQHVAEEGRLRVQRTWLWGEGAGRPALCLSFAAPGQPLESSLVPGTALDASLVFYPSAYPLRALVKQRYSAEPMRAFTGYATLAAAAQAYAQALACQPWIERFAVALRAAWPVRTDDRWWVRDPDGRAWPITPGWEAGWSLLALSGGCPLPLFGEWDGHDFLPLSAWASDRLVALRGGSLS
jgi:hypothetical protein